LRFSCMFLLFHLVLSNSYVRRFFSQPLLVVIGGMCYSIYLLHFAVVSAMGSILPPPLAPFSDWIWFMMSALIMTLAVLVVSSVYFLLVEKPFMKPFFRNKPLRTGKIIS